MLSTNFIRLRVKSVQSTSFVARQTDVGSVPYSMASAVFLACNGKATIQRTKTFFWSVLEAQAERSPLPSRRRVLDRSLSPMSTNTEPRIWRNPLLPKQVASRFLAHPTHMAMKS
ncbi:hypothetical protein D3C84_908670 [compost metagenome]